MQEALSQDGSAALVTKDIAQCRSILDNTLAIVKARISSCA